MIAQGKTIKELRDPHHPFGNALREMYDTCDLVCSAPLAAILAGEHAGVDGAMMLVAPLPLRVYVGTLGRNERSGGSLPILSNFSYYDPVLDELADRSHNPEYLGAEENLRNIGKLLGKIAQDQEPSLKFLPAEIVVLSEAPPGRGANWSGALAVALALALYLLQGERVLPEQLDSRTWHHISQVIKRDDEIETLFRMALALECISHTLASGYGPACSLLPALGKLFLYKGFIDPKYALARSDARRNSSFFLCHWDTYQERLATREPHEVGALYDIFIVDSGRSKSTADRIARLRGAEEDKLAQDFVNLLGEDPNQAAEALERSPSLPDQILREHRIGIGTLGLTSLLAVKTLRDCCGGLDDPSSVLRVVQSLDQVHRRLGLSFLELDQIRRELDRKLRQHRVAVKITGGGGGGDIVVWGLRDEIKAIPLQPMNKEKPGPTVVWQLSRDGFAESGASCDYSAQPLPFKRFASAAFPRSRTPQAHQATILSTGDKTMLMPTRPGSLFDVYRALRDIALEGPGLYLYYYDDNEKDRYEPLYLTWPSPNTAGISSIQSFAFHADEGFVTLKQLLLLFAHQSSLSLENPVIDKPTLSYYAHQLTEKELETTRDALNRSANKCEQVTGFKFKFPHLATLKTGKGRRVELKLPETTHLFVIRPLIQ